MNTEPGPDRPFGEWLRWARRRAGLTQVALARLAGVSVGCVTDLEQGRRRPMLATAEKLFVALQRR